MSYDVLVVGAGLAGLSAARDLAAGGAAGLVLAPASADGSSRSPSRTGASCSSVER